MFGLHEEKITKQEKKWGRKKKLLDRKKKLNEEKKQYFPRLKVPTSKLLILFLFINCTLIEIFTGFITLKSFELVAFTGMMPDFAPLITLIGAVVSEVIGFAIYSLKALKENTVGGIVYDTAMKELDAETSSDTEPEAKG